tara:strand:+ start:2338 stop:2544 length:207 start_codon:yes stop_codon:yes gene_type:complete
LILQKQKAKNTFFLNCNLKGAIFDITNLENADFSTAYNFSINPSSNQIKNAFFQKTTVLGYLVHLILE